MNNPLTTLREELYESYGELVGLEKEELAGAYTKFIDSVISRTLDLVSEEYKYPKVVEGTVIEISRYDGGKERHFVDSASYSEWNNIVPFEINTCCGNYRPTSGADGYWESSSHALGGWKVIAQPLSQILSRIQELKGNK